MIDCPVCGESLSYVKDPRYMFINAYGTYTTCTNRLCKEFGVARCPHAPFYKYDLEKYDECVEKLFCV